MPRYLENALLLLTGRTRTPLLIGLEYEFVPASNTEHPPNFTRHRNLSFARDCSLLLHINRPVPYFATVSLLLCSFTCVSNGVPFQTHTSDSRCLSRAWKLQLRQNSRYLVDSPTATGVAFSSLLNLMRSLDAVGWNEIFDSHST
jgi:hypothetical protein